MGKITNFICGFPIGPPYWPSDVPPAVSSYWSATGCPLLLHGQQTLTVPQTVDSWWLATGSAFFATKDPLPLPSIITEQDPNTSLATATINISVPSNPGRPGSVASTAQISGTKTRTDPPVPTTQSASSQTELSTPPSSTTSISMITTTFQMGTSSFTPDNSSKPPGSPTDTSAPPLSSSIPPSTTSPSALAAKHNKKTIPIVIGVVVPFVLIILGVAAFILYKRRQRARDRREWERTHEAIADAVRQVGAPAAAGLPAWNPARGDVKEPLDGDTAPLFEKFGGSLPGSLGHSATELLSHSRAPSSLI